MQITQGMILQLGKHTLGCGSSTDKEFVKKVIGNETIHSIQTDPPYGVAIAQSSMNPTAHKPLVNDHLQSDKEYIQFTKDWLEPVKPFLAKKNSIYCWNSDKMIFALREAMIQSEFKFSQLLVWVKNQSTMARLDYLPAHELIAFGWFGTHKFYKAQDKSVLYAPKPQKSKYHATMKPISLIRRLILNSTQIEETVYDPFLGSGTTLLAAHQTLRKCIGIELEPEYCQVIVNRWEKLTGFKASVRKDSHAK
jgi:site-specific DNA-methyltransferase (adenine-specific)